MFIVFKQYLLTPIKMKTKKIVEAKLNGKNSWVNQNNPVKIRPKKFRKKKLGFTYFLVNSESLGKLNNIITKSGVKLRRWWSQESKYARNMISIPKI